MSIIPAHILTCNSSDNSAERPSPVLSNMVNFWYQIAAGVVGNVGELDIEFFNDDDDDFDADASDDEDDDE